MPTPRRQARHYPRPHQGSAILHHSYKAAQGRRPWGPKHLLVTHQHQQGCPHLLAVSSCQQARPRPPSGPAAPTRMLLSTSSLPPLGKESRLLGTRHVRGGSRTRQTHRPHPHACVPWFVVKTRRVCIAMYSSRGRRAVATPCKQNKGNVQPKLHECRGVHLATTTLHAAPVSRRCCSTAPCGGSCQQKHQLRMPGSIHNSTTAR